MSHYKIGYTDYLHKGKRVRSVVGNNNFSSFTAGLDQLSIEEEGFIPAGYKYRPDLISYAFYGDPDMFWFVMLYNGLFDTAEDFDKNTRVLFPTL